MENVNESKNPEVLESRAAVEEYELAEVSLANAATQKPKAKKNNSANQGGAKKKPANAGQKAAGKKAANAAKELPST